MQKKELLVTVLRICMGFIFLWAFFDKLLGFGFSTSSGNAWIHGGSPTSGFLLHGTHGVFAPMFQVLAGNVIIDWIFMVGLLGIGLALIAGKLMKLAVWSGMIMLALMYLAALPFATPGATNPIVDEHLIYIIVLALFLYI